MIELLGYSVIELKNYFSFKRLISNISEILPKHFKPSFVLPFPKLP